jgi:hemerythrin-like metal-binding protein
MAFIDWTDEFTVDNGPIDEQHRQLVEIVNKFEEANRRGKGSRIMNEILNDLMGYTQEHFAFEEKVMAEAGYEKVAQHQSQHRQLIRKLEKFQFDFNNQGRRITAGMKDFLKYWLTSHILKDDKAYISSLEKEEV